MSNGIRGIAGGAIASGVFFNFVEVVVVSYFAEADAGDGLLFEVVAWGEFYFPADIWLNIFIEKVVLGFIIKGLPMFDY